MYENTKTEKLRKRSARIKTRLEDLLSKLEKELDQLETYHEDQKCST